MMQIDGSLIFPNFEYATRPVFNSLRAGADLDELVEWGSISAGVWGRCEPPVGPGRSPVGDQGAKPPEAPGIWSL